MEWHDHSTHHQNATYFEADTNVEEIGSSSDKFARMEPLPTTLLIISMTQEIRIMCSNVVNCLAELFISPLNPIIYHASNGLDAVQQINKPLE